MEDKKSIDYHNPNTILELEKTLEYAEIDIAKFCASICDVRDKTEHAGPRLFSDFPER